MVLNRRRILTSIAAAGIAVGAPVGGGAAFASAASPAHSAVTATAAAPASVWRGDGWCAKGKMSSQVPKPVADYLGLSQAQVGSKLQSGKSLADVARAQGKPVSGLKGTILATVTSQVDASSKLSSAQKAKVIGEVKSHLDAIVNATCKHGMGSHHMG